MARKKPHEEHENHERWLVSYADFITLLFAFFVVMYSVSSVNEGKYRVLSESMVSAFRSSTKSLEPIQIGSSAKSPAAAVVQPRRSPMVMPSLSNHIPSKRREGEGKGKGQKRAEEELARLGRAISGALKMLVDEDLVKIHRKKNWVEVEIKDSVLFGQGNAKLQGKAVVVLKKLADILRKVGNPLRIEGYTDDQPVRSRRYPTNWDLSLARAASVVKLFEKEQVSPWRMSAAGFGEYRPVASNALPEGRARNRRVVLVILASRADETRYELAQEAAAEKKAAAVKHADANTEQNVAPRTDAHGGTSETVTAEAKTTAEPASAVMERVVAGDETASMTRPPVSAVREQAAAVKVTPRLPPPGTVSVITPPIPLATPIPIPRHLLAGGQQ